MRLDKYLADLTQYSRKEVKIILKQKRVSVNEVVVKNAKLQVAETSDVVRLDGVALHYQTFFYYMMNKPADVLSATKDKTDTTVLDLLADGDYREDLFPVGRLDKDTTGLVILSNDGQLAHQLLSPKKHVPKLYEATVNGCVNEADVARFAKGIELTDFTTQPAKLTILDANAETSNIQVQIMEGKFHQVKRMFGAIEKPVRTLNRIQMGQLKLDESLELGAYRPLTENELTALQTRP